MTAARDGDFRRLPDTGEGVVAELTAVLNQIMDRSTHFNREVQRVKRELVRHGRLDERLSASPGPGDWTTRVNDVDQVLDALVAPAANATRVLDAVAGGDLTQRVDQLSLFTGEVTRVAREVRGANGYVPKPVDVDRLLTVACDLLDPEGAEPARDARAHAGRAAPAHGAEGRAGAEEASTRRPEGLSTAAASTPAETPRKRNAEEEGATEPEGRTAEPEGRAAGSEEPAVPGPGASGEEAVPSTITE